MDLLPAHRANPAPDWHVTRWFGGERTLAALRGRVIVLHTFQMLCPGCVLHGVPQAARVNATFPAADVAVVGLHTVFEHHEAMAPHALAAFLHEYAVPFPVGVDAHAPGEAVPRTMAAYALRGTPSLVLIDRQGRLRLSRFGRVDDLALGAAIATLAGEPADAHHPETASAGCDADGCPLPPTAPRSTP